MQGLPHAAGPAWTLRLSRSRRCSWPARPVERL